VDDGLQWDTFATQDEASDAAHTHAREVGAEFQLCDEDGGSARRARTGTDQRQAADRRGAC
jgi:hypothetical protein